MEFTVSFVHPEGPRKGLDVIVDLESALRKVGARPVDHGTCFEPQRVRGKRKNIYTESDVTAVRQGRVPIAAIKAVLFKAGIPRFRVKKNTRCTARDEYGNKCERPFPHRKSKYTDGDHYACARSFKPGR